MIQEHSSDGMDENDLSTAKPLQGYLLVKRNKRFVSIFYRLNHNCLQQSVNTIF